MILHKHVIAKECPPNSRLDNDHCNCEMDFYKVAKHDVHGIECIKCVDCSILDCHGRSVLCNNKNAYPIETVQRCKPVPKGYFVDHNEIVKKTDCQIQSNTIEKPTGDCYKNSDCICKPGFEKDNHEMCIPSKTKDDKGELMNPTTPDVTEPELINPTTPDVTELPTFVIILIIAVVLLLLIIVGCILFRKQRSKFNFWFSINQ